MFVSMKKMRPVSSTSWSFLGGRRSQDSGESQTMGSQQSASVESPTKSQGEDVFETTLDSQLEQCGALQDSPSSFRNERKRGRILTVLLSLIRIGKPKHEEPKTSPRPPQSCSLEMERSTMSNFPRYTDRALRTMRSITQSKPSSTQE